MVYKVYCCLITDNNPMYPAVDEEHKKSIIRMFRVSKYYGDRPALEDISLDIYPGEFIFLSGPSGAGKSTLLKVLYLAEKISRGQIIVNGMNLARIPAQKLPFLRRKFGMIFQDFKLIPYRTVFENVALVLEAAGKNSAFIKDRVMHVLESAGMADKAHEFPLALSGGEQQRVAMARAVVGNPDIILADEPTGSLDTESAHMVLEALMAYHARGATIIMASHNLFLLKTLVNGRNVVLEHGKLVGAVKLL